MTTPAVLYDAIPPKEIEKDLKCPLPSAPILVLAEPWMEYETILEEPDESDYVIIDSDVPRPVSSQEIRGGDADLSTTSPLQGTHFPQTVTDGSKKLSHYFQRRLAKTWNKGCSLIKDSRSRLQEDVLEPTAFGVSQTYSWVSDSIVSQLPNSSTSSSQTPNRLAFPQRIIGIGDPLICNVVLEESDESDSEQEQAGDLIVPASTATIYDIETDADVFDYEIISADDLRDDNGPTSFHHSSTRTFFELTNHQPEVLAILLFHAAATGTFMLADSTREHSMRAFVASQAFLQSAQRKWEVLKQISPAAREASDLLERGYHSVRQPIQSLLPAITNNDDTVDRSQATAIEMGTRGADAENQVSPAVQLTQ